MPGRPTHKRRRGDRLTHGQTPPPRLAYMLTGGTLDDHTIRVDFSAPLQSTPPTTAWLVTLDGSTADVDSVSSVNGSATLTLLDSTTGITAVRVTANNPDQIHVGLPLAGRTTIQFPGLP